MQRSHKTFPEHTLNTFKAVGRDIKGISLTAQENRSMITRIVVKLLDFGRSVMKSTRICNQDLLVEINGRSFLAERCPLSDVSTSAINGNSGSGRFRKGPKVNAVFSLTKASSTVGFHFSFFMVRLSREVQVAAILL